MGRHALYRAVCHPFHSGSFTLIGNRILLMSPHPGQRVTGELNSDGRDPVGMPRAAESSDRIHDLLFADRIEEQETTPAWLTPPRTSSRGNREPADPPGHICATPWPAPASAWCKSPDGLAKACRAGLVAQGADPAADRAGLGASMRVGSTTRCWCPLSAPPSRPLGRGSAAVTFRSRSPIPCSCCSSGYALGLMLAMVFDGAGDDVPGRQ